MALLTWLGTQSDPLATVKAGSLLFSPFGVGIELPRASISRGEATSTATGETERVSYSGVRA